MMGCSSTESISDQNKVNQLTTTKNYKALIDIYKSKIVNDPSDWESQIRLSQAYLDYKDIESANFYIDRVLLLSGSNSGKAYFLKGEILSEQLNFESALEKYEMAKYYGYNNAKLYLKMGVANAQIRQYEEAIDLFNQARLRGYDDNTIKNNLAVVHLYQGEYQKSVNILQPVYEIDSTDKKIESNLKIALSLLDELNRNSDPNSTSLVTGESDIDDSSVNDIEYSEITAQEYFLSQEKIENISAEEENKKYYVQVGSYPTFEEALEKRQELVSTGLEVDIRQSKLNNSETWFRLLNGEFNSYRQAQGYALNKQELNGLEYFIQVIR